MFHGPRLCYNQDRMNLARRWLLKLSWTTPQPTASCLDTNNGNIKMTVLSFPYRDKISAGIDIYKLNRRYIKKLLINFQSLRILALRLKRGQQVRTNVNAMALIFVLLVLPGACWYGYSLTMKGTFSEGAPGSFTGLGMAFSNDQFVVAGAPIINKIRE